MSALVNTLPAGWPTQPGAVHCSPYSRMPGLRATACRAIENS